MEHYPQSAWPGWSYASALPQYGSYQAHGEYPAYIHDHPDSSQGHHYQQHLVHHHQMSRTTESKPRLSKEEVEVLEAEFRKNHKPNSTVKKALAESMRVDNARINNWFQNRRAREKKENNIRQYEARQRLEKTQNGTGQYQIDHTESRGLTASSAPFPSARSMTRQGSQSGSSATSVEGNASEHTRSPTYASSAGYGTGSAASPAHPKLETPGPTAAVACTLSTEEVGFSYSDKYGVPDYFPDSNSTLSQATSESQYRSDQDAEAFSQSSPGTTSARSASADLDTAFPPSEYLDAASRRDRRPPPLAIGNARNCVSTGPRTAVDGGYKHELSRDMRRIASASSTGRITKPATGPRTPFHDRRTEGLFHLNRSPVLGIGRNNLAPPTPDTPIVAGQPTLRDTIASSNTLMAGTKIQNAGLVAHDPTLRTPPATPGLGDPMYNLNSSYNLSISEQPLTAAGLGPFPNSLALPSLTMAAPNYAAGPSPAVSQPTEAPYTAASMGTGCLAYGGENSGYTWPANSGTGRTSPGQSAPGAQFMNAAGSNFD